MSPTASSWDTPFVHGAVGPTATLLRAAASHNQHSQRQWGNVGEVSPVPFAHHLPPNMVPGLVPQAASVTLHQPHVTLPKSGCPAEQSWAQQPVGPGDDGLLSQPKPLQEVAAVSEHPGVHGQQ